MEKRTMIIGGVVALAVFIVLALITIAILSVFVDKSVKDEEEQEKINRALQQKLDDELKKAREEEEKRKALEGQTPPLQTGDAQVGASAIGELPNTTTQTGGSSNSDLPSVKSYRYETIPNKIGRNLPCPGKTVLPNTNPNSYCMVNASDAPEICQSLENCGGYSITSNANHMVAYPNSAQLFDKRLPLDTNSQWTVYQQIVN